jgi:flagella basal body P-ring formation protein FlgA
MSAKHALLAFALGLLLPPCGHAATLRTTGALGGPVVRISDLFDGAGDGASRILGPSPAPGQRIVVEAPQLAAIARQFGVDWRPASLSDRSVLERPGRLLPREAVLGPLRAALAGVGAPPDADIDLPGFAAPMIAVEARPEADVEQLDFDAASGRFTASFLLTGDGVGTLRMRLDGVAREMIEIPVPRRRLTAGTVIGEDDLRMSRVRAALVRGDVVRSIEQAAGFAPRRSLFPEQPIALADITRPNAVFKGDRVAVELSAPGLTVAAQAVAAESAALGERVRIVNPGSRAVVEAQVVGPDRVRVLPGSLPITPPGDGVAQVAER